VRAFKESAGALYAAEAGLRQTIQTWSSTGASALNPGDSVVVGGGWQTLSPTAAKYRAVVHRVDNSAGTFVFLLVVQGRGAGENKGQRSIEAVITSTAPRFQYAAATTGTMTFSGASSTDTISGSYSSVTGASGADGNLVAGGNISLTGVTKGDVTTAGTLSLGGGAKVFGDTQSHATGIPTWANPTCPAMAYTPASQLSGAGSDYNPTTGELKNPGADVTLSGASVYYFSNIILSGGKKLIIDPSSGPVTIYLSGQLNVSGGGIVNTGAKPTQLAMSACGSNTSNWTLSGSSNAYMTLYGPTHALTISGGGDFYGAVVAKQLTASGGSFVRFDEALIAASSTLALIAGSWTELTLY
jgi:hypothetical protein